MNNDFKELLESVIKGSLQPIEKELLALKKEVTDIKVEQQKTNERLDGIEAKLDATKEQVVKNAEGISLLQAEQQEMKSFVEQIPEIKQAVTETSQDVKTLMTSQAKQDKILERLSVRSIEHEADIAELRKIK